MLKLGLVRIAPALKAAAALAVVGVALWATDDLWLPRIGRWLAIPAAAGPRSAEAIIVHGGNYTRTKYAAAMFRRGLAPEFWHTAYANSQAEITTQVEGTGVPVKVFRFFPSTSTWTDGTQIAAAIRARGLHRVIIVTDWWHSRRALCATKQQLGGYDVSIAFEPSPDFDNPENWWRDTEGRRHVVSELVKLGYYAVRYGMNPWGC